MNTKAALYSNEKSRNAKLPSWEERQSRNQEKFDSWIQSMTTYDREVPAGARALIEIVDQFRRSAEAQAQGDKQYAMQFMPDEITVEPLTNEAVKNDISHYSKFKYFRLGPVEIFSGTGHREEDFEITEYKQEDPQFALVHVCTRLGANIQQLDGSFINYPRELEYKFVRKLR